MNHDITNNGDSYPLDFSPPFRKPHLLSMRMHWLQVYIFKYKPSMRFIYKI